MGAERLVRSYRLLGVVAPALVSNTAAEEQQFSEELVGPADAHVIASAVGGGAGYVVTLDRRHLARDRARDAGLPCAVVTPGETLAVVRRKGAAGSL